MNEPTEKPSLALDLEGHLLCPECNQVTRAVTYRECQTATPFPEHILDKPVEIQTLVGFCSPPGHKHDDNCLTRTYQCPHGHKLSVAVRRSCSACDWRGRAQCFCHPWRKLDQWPKEPEAI